MRGRKLVLLFNALPWFNLDFEPIQGPLGPTIYDNELGDKYVGSECIYIDIVYHWDDNIVGLKWGKECNLGNHLFFGLKIFESVNLKSGLWIKKKNLIKM